jgi:hypothetical protein
MELNEENFKSILRNICNKGEMYPNLSTQDLLDDIIDELTPYFYIQEIQEVKK